MSVIIYTQIRKVYTQIRKGVVQGRKDQDENTLDR